MEAERTLIRQDVGKVMDFMVGDVAIFDRLPLWPTCPVRNITSSHFIRMVEMFNDNLALLVHRHGISPYNTIDLTRLHRLTRCYAEVQLLRALIDTEDRADIDASVKTVLETKMASLYEDLPLELQSVWAAQREVLRTEDNRTLVDYAELVYRTVYLLILLGELTVSNSSVISHVKQHLVQLDLWVDRVGGTSDSEIVTIGAQIRDMFQGLLGGADADRTE